jgi:protoporphyrinogen oxidase
MKVGIIGGGVAGLVAGYELSKAGSNVTILEREPRMGGLAGSFAIGPGQEIEKYYHFICKPDQSYLAMLRELGLTSRLRWVTTEMGLFYKGTLCTIGDPLSLMAFPYLSVGDKIRFVWATARTKFSSSKGWKALENVRAREWLIRQYGQRAYELLYAPLLDHKFREYAPGISAAWMWARFYRLGNSRTIMQRERVGYLEGGSQVYIETLERALRERGADLRTSATVERIVFEGERAVGVQCGGERLEFDYVLSTAPIPHMGELLRDTAGPYLDNLRQLQYIGVLVMVLRLRHSLSKYFWMNISDPEISLPGVIEYTNLNPLPQLGGDVILYLPQYLPAIRSLYEMAPQDLFDLYCRYLGKINPAFKPDWVRDYWVHRNPFAQPICGLGFSGQIPAIQTPIAGFYLTDSYQIHPNDRTISDSTRLGREAARLIMAERRDTVSS